MKEFTNLLAKLKMDGSIDSWKLINTEKCLFVLSFGQFRV